MSRKISLKWSLFNISLAVITSINIFLLTLDLPIQDSYAKPISVDSVQNVSLLEPTSIGLPVRLKIPKINVDAAIDQVGLTSDGAMDIPKGPTSAAWFNLGPRPGEIGSAVIDGHFGWGNGIAAIFDNLHKLSPGDQVYTEDENGLTNTFIVKTIRNYDPEADATNVFSSNDAQAHLNLITCGGAWNETEKSYANRLVVFADKEIK